MYHYLNSCYTYNCLLSISPFVSIRWKQWMIRTMDKRRTSSLIHIPRAKKTYKSTSNKNGWPGFPGGAVVESLPDDAGDTGSSPGLGGSHVPRSSWAREPQLLSLRVWSLCSATREAAMVRGLRTAMKSGPRLPQLEKALAQRRRLNTVINK